MTRWLRRMQVVGYLAGLGYAVAGLMGADPPPWIAWIVLPLLVVGIVGLAVRDLVVGIPGEERPRSLDRRLLFLGLAAALVGLAFTIFARDTQWPSAVLFLSFAALLGLVLLSRALRRR